MAIQQTYTILTVKQVIAKIGKSRSFIYTALDEKHHRHDSKFPKPIKLGARSIGFLEHEINAWLKAKADARG